jgi:prolipoprotein diacylglyceryl transferase
MVRAYLPSPSRGVLHLGPLPLRAYALFILLGVLAAVVIGERRWRARGGVAGTVADVATIAVPVGLVGGRLYHVITTPELYFGKGRHPVEALYVWRGGLGIWGAIALGGIGAWYACNRRGISIAAFGDAVAPGIAVAQAIGRLGNWFNQELYGRPTTLPWALRIDAEHRPPDTPNVGLYHPTFLYELLWNLGVAALVVWAERRFRLRRGRAFALYVAAYTVGRFWIEALRVDAAHHIFGLRLNDWVSILVFLGAVAFMVLRRGDRGRGPAQDGLAPPAETGVEEGRAPEPETEAGLRPT